MTVNIRTDLVVSVEEIELCCSESERKERYTVFAMNPRETLFSHICELFPLTKKISYYKFFIKYFTSNGKKEAAGSEFTVGEVVKEEISIRKL